MDVKKKPAVTVQGTCVLSPTLVQVRVLDMLKRAKIRRGSLSIVFLTDRAMRALNRKALGHDYVTDVITFDLSMGTAPDSIDGEIYVCPVEARRNAARYGEPLEREVFRYIAHGILHLLGYDDATADDRDLMHQLEDRLLRL